MTHDTLGPNRSGLEGTAIPAKHASQDVEALSTRVRETLRTLEAADEELPEIVTQLTEVLHMLAEDMAGLEEERRRVEAELRTMQWSELERPGGGVRRLWARGVRHHTEKRLAILGRLAELSQGMRAVGANATYRMKLRDALREYLSVKEPEEQARRRRTMRVER